MVPAIIFLTFRTKETTQPKFKFAYIIFNRICSFSHSLKNNPNIMTDKYDKTFWYDSVIGFFTQ